MHVFTRLNSRFWQQCFSRYNAIESTGKTTSVSKRARCGAGAVHFDCGFLKAFNTASNTVWLFPDEDEEHPAVEEGESVADYQTRTETYWTKLARANMGPDAKDKKVAKVALAMAKVFYEDQ